jgi:uncharacterized protein
MNLKENKNQKNIAINKRQRSKSHVQNSEEQQSILVQTPNEHTIQDQIIDDKSLNNQTKIENLPKMTLKAAILKSLADIGKLATYQDVHNHISNFKYYNFSNKKTSKQSVSTELGNFIRGGDTRVKRIKLSNGESNYLYYLTANEQNIESEILDIEINELTSTSNNTSKYSYSEKDLHILLSSYLKNTGIFSKTITHQISKSNDDNQTWTHPDMCGVKFLKLKTEASQLLLKRVNIIESFKISSYELKREINSDNELKKAYFQTVSNSSWANYGYLVAFEINDNLNDEMARLNQSFGIGIIELNANPYQSKILYPAKYRDLDFKTIDKLCNINAEFLDFIHSIKSLISADEEYFKPTEKSFTDFCDSFFINDSDIETYCKEKRIPYDQDDYQ